MEILTNAGHVSDMDVLLIRKEGIDLYETLVLSETSRKILRFYRPVRLSYGVLIVTSSLGGALSLLDEIRWYLRRYVREVIIAVGDGVYCTHSLAQEIYERAECFSPQWEYRALYLLKEGKLTERRPLEITEDDEMQILTDEFDEILEVMMCNSEYKELFSDTGDSNPEVPDVDDLLFPDPET